MSDQQIRFVFEGDTTDLEGALRGLRGGLGETQDEADDLGTSGDRAAKLIKISIIAATAQVIALTAALAKTVFATLDLAAKADKVAKSAAAVGASVEEWQKIVGAFELGGLGAAAAEMAIKKLGLRIGQVAAGAGGPAADAFAQLGLAWQELEALPLPERMAAIADKVKDLGSATKRAAVLNAIFEESGIQMAGAFAAGGDAIRDAAQQIEDAGLISAKVAKQSEDMSDAVTVLKGSYEGLRTEALAPIIPLITAVSEQSSAMMQEFRDTEDLEQFGELFNTTFLDVIAPSAIFASGVLVKSFAALAPAMAAAEVAMQRLRQVGLLIGDIDEAVRTPLATLKKLVEGESILSDETVGATSKVAEASDKLAESLRNLGAIQETSAAAQDKAYTALEKIKKALKDVKPAAEDASKALGEVDDALEEMGSRVLSVEDDDGITLGDGFVSVEDDIEAHAEFLKKQASEIAEAFSPVADAFDKIAGSLGDLFSQAASNIADTIAESQEEIASLDEQIANATTDRERKMLKDRKRLIEEEVKEQKKAALAMFVAQKVASLAQASVATALAVITGFAQGGPPLAIAAGIAGAISIAAIAAEPPPSFHSGGMVSMGAPDEITARLLRSEAVLSPQGVAAAGGEDGVRELNRGSGGSTPIVSVLQVRSRVVDAMISDNLRQKQGPLTDALRAARPRALGRHNPFASS